MKILNCVLCGVEKEDKLLMIKRNNEPYRHHWTLPGGKVEFGEHIEQAAEREIKEETNLDCKAEKICGIGTEIQWENAKRKGHFVMFVVKLMPEHFDIIESKEGQLMWIEKDKIKDLNKVPSDHELIKRYLINDSEVKVNKIKINQNGETYEMEEFL